MDRLPPFIRWLSVAALLDWLLTRTLARSAIFMPKSPPLLVVYETLIVGGQLASVLSALLALIGMGWLAWRLRGVLKGTFSLILISLTVISLISMAVPPVSLVRLATQLLSLAAILWIGLHAWRQATDPTQKAVVLFPWLALLMGRLYQTSQMLFAAFDMAGPPASALILFNLGELLVVLSPIGIWWAYHRLGRDNISLYLWAAIPALLFVMGYFLDPSMAGILSIWSSGLTLYLPWPVYSFSLWLFGFVILVGLKRDSAASVALLLLAAGGYAPQLSSQVFFGLVGLSLLSIRPNFSDLVDYPAHQRVSSSPHAIEVS